MLQWKVCCVVLNFGRYLLWNAYNTWQQWVVTSVLFVHDVNAGGGLGPWLHLHLRWRHIGWHVFFSSFYRPLPPVPRPSWCQTFSGHCLWSLSSCAAVHLAVYEIPLVSITEIVLRWSMHEMPELLQSLTSNVLRQFRYRNALPPWDAQDGGGQ